MEILSFIESKPTEDRSIQKIQEMSPKEFNKLLSTAAHDFLEPLRAIQGYCDLMLRVGSEDIPEKYQGWILNIQNSSIRCQSMVDTLTEYLRLDSTMAKKEFITLEKLLFAVVKEAREMNPEATIRSDFKDIYGLTIFGDEETLRKSFLEVIVNASKFHSNHVKPEINIAARTENNEVIINVSDNGPGIAENFRESIFQLFVRLHSYGRVKGHGIGLAYVMKVIELHNGYFCLRSSGSEGSNFEIRLPVN